MEEIIKERLRRLQALREKRLSQRFLYCHTIGEVLADFKPERKISTAGRIVFLRSHGKAIFCDLKDSSGKIQIYIKSDFVGTEDFLLFKYIDIGDILGVEGETFLTRTGEPTIKVTKFYLLAKSLRPLPEKWHGLRDIEKRYRHRYLDLISNDKIKDVFLMRSRIISFIRSFLDSKGYLEVETPILHPIPGGATGEPFKTYHNELNLDLFLRIAPELYLKRLLVAGLPKVYEINKNFRNEGISTRHSPEFTMLEVYSAYTTYGDMMELCEELVSLLAKEIFKKEEINYQGKTIDLKTPWQKRSFSLTLRERFGISPQDSSEEMVEKLRKKRGVILKERLTRSQIIKIAEEILEEESFYSPVFFVDYFTFLCPLAKAKDDDPNLSERFELFVGGMEIANAYTELNDSVEQRERFLGELKELRVDKLQTIDEDFIEALEYGMPPAAGLGIGIDRLVMLFTDQPSIRDVILFPLLRPRE